MKKSDKKRLISWIIFLAILLLAGIILFFKYSQEDKQTIQSDVIKCIGEHSTLYVQLGCHYCKMQEDMFGDSLKYLKIVDCFYTPENCSNIKGTPTWEINGKYYLGVRNIDELKNLTGC